MASIAEKLPDEPLFRHVLQVFRANPSIVFVKDRVKDIEAHHMQLLMDILCMRRQIAQALSSSMFELQRKNHLFWPSHQEITSSLWQLLVSFTVVNSVAKLIQCVFKMTWLLSITRINIISRKPCMLIPSSTFLPSDRCKTRTPCSLYNWLSSLLTPICNGTTRDTVEMVCPTERRRSNV